MLLAPPAAAVSQVIKLRTIFRIVRLFLFSNPLLSTILLIFSFHSTTLKVKHYTHIFTYIQSYKHTNSWIEVYSRSMDEETRDLKCSNNISTYSLCILRFSFC